MARSAGGPVVGISVGDGSGWRTRGLTYRAYAGAVLDAGGTPVAVGLRGKADLRNCDGLLVPGGWDIHPRHYDPPPGDESLKPEEIIRKFGVRTEEERDEPEFSLITEAVQADKPLLAICRGIQSINVALNRRLIPDIEMCLPGSLPHRSPPLPGPSLAHPVCIVEGSLLEQVYGTRQLIVNTRHHQGMTTDMVADMLRVTALAPDGVVEAVEGVSHRFLVGVQWHPERRADTDIHARSRPLFEAFVRACGGR